MSQPLSGMTMTLARMYPVATQATSSTVAPRFPPIVLSATLTIVVSMIAMIRPSITVMVMSATEPPSRWRTAAALVVS